MLPSGMDFQEAYRIGRRKLSLLGLYRERHLLLSLDELYAVHRPAGETYAGVRDVPTGLILGSENRSADFSEGFYPVHKWMANRWTRVKELLLADKIDEPIRLIEYGGRYFVRDGNHRVSIARTNGIEYLTAELSVLRPELDLPANISRATLPVYAAMLVLQRETRIFDIIPQDNFAVALPETWERIKESIIVGHRDWYARKNGAVPDRDTLIRSWNVELYETTMEFIRRHHLPALAAGRLETDIFCEMMELWSQMPDAWFSDVYDRYVRRARWANFPRYLVSAARRLGEHFASSPAEERDMFLQVSRLLFFRPDADLPAGNKRWYRFLRAQLMGSHRRYLARRLDRHPHMHELTGSWYDELFAPAYALWSSREVAMPFQQFYPPWMKRWQRAVTLDGTCTLERSFELMLQRLKLFAPVKQLIKKPARAGKKKAAPGRGKQGRRA